MKTRRRAPSARVVFRISKYLIPKEIIPPSSPVRPPSDREPAAQISISSERQYHVARGAPVDRISRVHEHHPATDDRAGAVERAAAGGHPVHRLEGAHG